MYTLLLSTSGGTNWIEPASALQELHFIYPILFAATLTLGIFCLFFDPGNFGPKRPKPHILVNVVGLMAVLARSVSWIWVDCFETRIEHMLADGLLKCEHRAHLHGILYDIT